MRLEDGDESDMKSGIGVCVKVVKFEILGRGEKWDSKLGENVI